MNAASVGQDLVHAAITGKSAFITASGDVTATSGLLTTEILMGEVQFRSAGRTLYARLGDWVLLVAMAAALAAIVTPGEDRPQLREPAAANAG